LGFVHVPSPTTATSAGHKLSTILYHLLSVSGLRLTQPAHLLALVQELDAQDQGADGNLDKDWKAWSESSGLAAGSPLHALTSTGWEYADAVAAGRYWAIGSAVADKLGVQDGVHLLVNGRVSWMHGLRSTVNSPSARRTVDRGDVPGGRL
jgi:UDP-glucose:glycoprotein glucosyltransferase